MTGECEEGLRDLVKGVCWYVFRDVELREKYMNELLLLELGVVGFRKWMGKLLGDYELVNGV